jgi:hypothetical protein
MDMSAIAKACRRGTRGRSLSAPLLLLLLLLITGSATALAATGGDVGSPGGSGVGKTGKERLSDKASDEQRTDDCKVPQARRTRTRPTGCP